jgi:hypothetical protein
MGKIADTKIPQTIAIGESLWCILTFADYPATLYTAKLFIDGTGSWTVTATAVNTTDFQFLVNPTDQTTWTAGPAAWRIIVTAITGGIATLVDSGLITMLGVDQSLAQARTILAAIKAVILGRATKEQATFSIGGLQINLLSHKDLLDAHDRWENEVTRLERRSLNQLGFGGPIRSISPRFENSAPGRPLFPRLYP